MPLFVQLDERFNPFNREGGGSRKPDPDDDPDKITDMQAHMADAIEGAGRAGTASASRLLAMAQGNMVRTGYARMGKGKVVRWKRLTFKGVKRNAKHAMERGASARTKMMKDRAKAEMGGGMGGGE